MTGCCAWRAAAGRLRRKCPGKARRGAERTWVRSGHLPWSSKLFAGGLETHGVTHAAWRARQGISLSGAALIIEGPDQGSTHVTDDRRGWLAPRRRHAKGLAGPGTYPLAGRPRCSYAAVWQPRGAASRRFTTGRVTTRAQQTRGASPRAVPALIRADPESKGRARMLATGARVRGAGAVETKIYGYTS